MNKKKVEPYIPSTFPVMACPRIFSSRIFCSLFGFFSIAICYLPVEAGEISRSSNKLDGTSNSPLSAAEPMPIEVGLDARLAAARMKLEIQEADEVLVGRAVPSDRIESPPVHERMLRFENVRVGC